MRLSRLLVAAAFVAAVGSAFVTAQSQSHLMSLADTKWGPAPPFLPAGAMVSVLYGDPGKAAPYAIRVKFPANYEVPAHSHPTDENITVASGTLFLGMGDKLDKTKGTALPVGGFAQMPATMNHFAFTKAETTIVLHGMGPVEFKYVNPQDDPRNKKK